MADKKKMSVAEIMAAARAEKGSGGPAPAASTPPAAEPDADAPAAEAPAPAVKPAAKPAAGGRPSVSEIMALARAKKGAEEAAPKPVAAKPAAKEPKPAAAKPAAAKAAAPAGAAKAGVQRDTASILAAARAAAKLGPVSKADAPTRPAPKPRESQPAAEKAAPARTVATVPPKPVKPAKKGDEGEDRRGFMQIALGSAMAMGFSALAVTGGLFSLGLARFLFPNVLAEPPSKFKVGVKDAFPSGKVETKYVPQYGVWVVNGDFQGQQQIYALKTVCTHLGCTPSWLEAEQKFKCPCHGSGFYKDGVNFEGPAPRPLERYAIRIADDGQLEIDKSRTFQEELGQWADPESYVTV
ncbi:MAG: ubiquinol-cytochrome c reductase iron-sulfur subunit [Planctomycetaceae bacterium]